MQLSEIHLIFKPKQLSDMTTAALQALFPCVTVAALKFCAGRLNPL